MRRMYFALFEAAVAAVFLIPILIYCKKQYQQSRWTTVLYILFAIYLSGVYSIAGLPSVIYVRYKPHFNLTPFLYMFSDYTNSLLNVALFVPLGFFLPVLWKKFHKVGWIIVIGFLTSLIIELLQIFTFRATDVNDLITNTLGTILGYVIAKFTLNLVRLPAPDGNLKTLRILYIAVFCIMFFVVPLFMSVALRIH